MRFSFLCALAAALAGWVYFDNRQFLRAYQSAQLEQITQGQQASQELLRINQGLLTIDDDAVDQHTLDIWAPAGA